MPGEHLHEPWRSFLRDIDAQLAGPTEIHCLGGFVVAEYYGLSRPTSDVDIIRVRGASDLADVQRIAGKGSPLAKKHRVYVDIVMVADVPERYEERLMDAYAGEFRNLGVRVFEKHDLALAKIGRNQDCDREDVRRLAQGPGLEIAILEQRYRNELRWQLANPEREDPDARALDRDDQGAAQPLSAWAMPRVLTEATSDTRPCRSRPEA